MTAVDFWTPARPPRVRWRRIDEANANGIGWQVYAPPADAARPDPGETAEDDAPEDPDTSP